MKEVSVAALQFGSTLDKQLNIERVLKLLDDLEASGARLDLICLPELFTLRAFDDVPDINDFIEPSNGPLEQELARRAAALGSYLVAGSFLRQEPSGDVHNESVVFDRDGSVLGRYRKTHLFDAPGHRESHVATPGDELVIFDADFGTVGIVICYELRFPEVARQLALAGASVLAVPNSWPIDGLTMASDQLRILLQGTALQNLCFILHANQFGRVGTLELCGRSCVVDPKGEIVLQASDSEQVVVGRIDLDRVAEMRAKRTTFSHRRPELYRPESVRRLRAERAGEAGRVQEVSKD